MESVPYGCFRGRSPGCACDSSFELFLPAVEQSEGRWIAGEEVDGNGYQLRLIHGVLVLQVLSEVEAVHVLIDETERVRLGRVYPHKRYHVYILVKEDPYANFVVELL